MAKILRMRRQQTNSTITGVRTAADKVAELKLPDSPVDLLKGVSAEQLSRLILNPLLSSRAPATFLPDTERKDTHPQVTVESGMLMGAGKISRRVHNADYQPPSLGKPVEKSIFNLNSPFIDFVFPQEAIVHHAKSGGGGISLGQDHTLHIVGGDSTLTLGTYMFLTRNNTQWNVGTSAGKIVQPLRCPDGRVIVPLMGSLLLGGEPLSEEVLTKLNLGALGTYAPGPNGEPTPKKIEYPMYVSGGRSVFIPLAYSIPVLPTSQGGLRIITDEADLASNSSAVCFLQAIATQWTGTGIQRYVYHSRTAESRATLREKGEVELVISDRQFKLDTIIAQRTRDAGKSGIILDLRHEGIGDAPTGGLITAKVSYDRDQKLLAAGAIISSLTTGYCVLFTKAELDAALGRDSGMVCDQVEVAVKAVLDDSRRMDAILSLDPKESRIENELRSFFNLSSGPIQRALFDPYVKRVATTLAHNFKVLSSLNLVHPTEQRFVDNVSVFGGLADSENLRDATNHYQFHSWIHESVRILVLLSKGAGLRHNEIWSGPGAGAIFIKELFGVSAGESLLKTILQFPFKGSPHGEQEAIFISNALIRRSLMERGVRFNSQKIAQMSLEFISVLPIAGAESALRQLASSSKVTRIGVEASHGRQIFLSADEFMDTFVLPWLLFCKIEQAAYSLAPQGEQRGNNLAALEEQGRLYGNYYEFLRP